MSKKIIYLDFDDIKNPLLGAGQAWATFEVGQRLAKKGYKVAVYCSKYPGYKDRVQNGIEYKHIGAATKFIRLNNLVYILTVPFHVARAKADLIVECFTAPVSTLLSPVFTKIPVIALPSMFNAKQFSKKYHLPFHWIETVGLKFYKYILPYSQTDSSKAKNLNRNIIYKIIGQGVSKDYFQIKKSKKKHILFLGRFDMDQKGIDLLLKSYSLVSSKIKFPLMLAGHGPDEAKVRALIKNLNLEKKVYIAGSAYGRKKYTLMSQAIFVAFPSRHDEMCLWTLEAFAAGLPIVCFDLPESKWIRDDISYKAKAYDIKEYSQLLLKASNLSSNYKKSRASRLFAKQFSWDKVANEFDSFFKFVLKEESKVNPAKKFNVAAN